MKLSEIQRLAKKIGVKDTWRHSKGYLIKAIQKQEGNFDCYGTAAGYCDQDSCIWRQDCIGK